MKKPNYCYVISAKEDSTQLTKELDKRNVAWWMCDGIDDQIEIQEAINWVAKEMTE